MNTTLTITIAAGVILGGVALGQAVEVDQALPEYKPVQGVSGTIKSVGSATMNNLMTLWGEGFKKHYPDCQIEVEGKESSTAPPALIAGTSTFWPMSREMKAKERDAFGKAFGHQPTAVPTSIDMLAVYVHKDNPIQGLTLQQVDSMFSENRKGGADAEIRTWGRIVYVDVRARENLLTAEIDVRVEQTTLYLRVDSAREPPAEIVDVVPADDGHLTAVSLLVRLRLRKRSSQP